MKRARRWLIPIGGGLLAAVMIVIATPDVVWFLRGALAVIAFIYAAGQSAAYLWSSDQGRSYNWTIGKHDILRVGDAASDAVFNRVLRDAVKTVEDAGFRFLVLGGLASSLVGRPRWTHDIDFLVRPDTGEFIVNEINTVPGSLSFYLWEQSGLGFGALLGQLVDLGLRRRDDKRSDQTNNDSHESLPPVPRPRRHENTKGHEETLKFDSS